MSGISDWLDMMTQVVTVEPFVSRDAYGAATYGAATDYQARVNYKSHFIRTADAEQVVARGTAWLAADGPISVNDRITLPDGSQPLLLDSNGENDEAGPLYVRLDFS